MAEPVNGPLLPRAVSVLALELSGPVPMFLCVSRRGFPDSVCMPGGKVDPGEDEAQAAIRETFEETGVLADRADLVPLFAGICPPGPDGRAFWSTTYLLRPGFDISKAGTREPGIFVSVRPLALLSSELDAFPEYNARALASLREMLPGI